MNTLDLVMVLLVMVGVTWLGHRLSGSIQSRHGFFAGDGNLPWWAVAGSIVATLVSAVTFVSVPAAVFAPGGDLTYFQVILGLALGKVAVALILVRAFYEDQTSRTSYEYIARQIDAPTGELTMYLGLVLNVINSGVKVLAASLVLEAITGWGLVASTGFVVAISVIWSGLAGIKTVIWTDFILFVFFCCGAVFVVCSIYFSVDLSLGEMWETLDRQAKLVLFDFSTDPGTRYSIWAAIIGAVALNIAQGGAQGTWQRVKACRSVKDAHKAYYASACFYVVHLVILLVGLGLVLFYSQNELDPAVGMRLVEQPDYIFPHFILNEIPVGLSGLFIAAIFAAAISTLDSALTESADMTMNHIYSRYIKPDASEAHYLRASRSLMLFWGIIFFFVTLFFAQYSAQGLLDLTFKLPNYVLGMLFGTIVLARLGIGRLFTILPGVLVALVITLLLANHGVAFFYWCPTAGLSMILTVWVLERLLVRS
ncbi:MAG: hypothetical protein AAF541_03880 [Pseudomonadota bacterium]